MNKTPIITIIALLVVVLIAFTGCEFEISLNGEENNTQTSIESIVVTDEEGSTQLETVVHYITTEPVPVVTVIEVTNEKGKVIETEKVTLSPEEVQQGKDFFNDDDDEETTKAADKNKDKDTNKQTTNKADKKPGKETTKAPDKVTEKETTKTPDKESNKNPSKNPNKETTKAPNKETTKNPNKETTKNPNKETTKEPNKVTEKETTASKEPTTNKVTTAPSKDNVKEQDDLAILKSSKYLIEGRVVAADGTSYPYKMARDGNRFTFKSVYDGQEVCIIVGSKYVYLVSTETKTYAKVSKELVKDETADSGEFDDLLTGDVFNLYANKNEVDTYTEKMYGVKYKVVEYDDGTCDYFDGKKLVMSKAPDGSTLYYDTISDNVGEGLFIPPADYKEEVVDIASTTSTTKKASKSN